jgi:hypothetical protein
MHIIEVFRCCWISSIQEHLESNLSRVYDYAPLGFFFWHSSFSEYPTLNISAHLLLLSDRKKRSPIRTYALRTKYAIPKATQESEWKLCQAQSLLTNSSGTSPPSRERRSDLQRNRNTQNALHSFFLKSLFSMSPQQTQTEGISTLLSCLSRQREHFSFTTHSATRISVTSIFTYS